MMIAIMAVYLVLLFLLVHFGIVRFNLFWKASPFIVLLLLNSACSFRWDGARRRVPRWWFEIRSLSCLMLREKLPMCRSAQIRR